ncbi:MAG: MBL fold metallo-hydrolase [Alphaproteobacteria bacterium]|nr:MBL fold metallo-hydrolase [Alphaproteobacteria bacterium]
MACGTGFSPVEAHPDEPLQACPVCSDERQYIPASGQKWTSLEALARRHMNAWRLVDAGLLSLVSEPKFAIGHRALLLNTPQGNILWDPIPLIDEATRDIVMAFGGLSAIAISHPHYYSTMVDWSDAFGGVPIYLHEDDAQWIMRPDEVIRLWSGETHALADGVTLIRCGGHFEGGAVLHWAQGAGGKGALLAGDIVMVVSDRKHVSFMRSYPNLIPLPASRIERIGAALEPYEFDAIYGPFFGRDIRSGGKDIVRRSVARYLRAIS